MEKSERMADAERQYMSPPEATDQRPRHLLRSVLALALPAVGEQLLNMLVGLADTYLVGHLGASATTAVGLANQLYLLPSLTLFSALAVAVTALVARATGARDRPLANSALGQAFLAGIALGLLATALGLGLGRQGLLLLGASPEVLPDAHSYLAIVSSSYLLAALTMVGNAALRGAGDTRTPLLVMMAVNIVNIVLAWLLIGGHGGLPALGVAGSAWGAAGGRAVGGLLVLWVLLRGRSGLRLRRPRLDRPMLRRLLKIGLPSAGEYLIFRVGMLLFAGMVATLGTVDFAAHTIGIQAESLSWLPGFGFSIAATTLVGQALGAGEPQLAQRNGYAAYAIGALFMSALGVLFFVFPAFFIGAFTSDPAVVAAGALPLRIMGLAQPVLASTIIFNGGLRGAGDTRWVLVANVVGVWGVRVPVTYVLLQRFGWGLEGAWTAMALDQLVRGGLAFLRFRSGRWKTIKV